MHPPVADELEIARLVIRLSMAGDDRDMAAYRACLFDWVDAALPGELAELVRGDDYAAAAIERLSTPDWTHHRPSWPLLVAGKTTDRAFGVVDFEVRTGWTDYRDRARAATAGGRYHLGFIRKSDRWLVCARSTTWRYHAGDLLSKPA